MFRANASVRRGLLLRLLLDHDGLALDGQIVGPRRTAPAEEVGVAVLVDPPVAARLPRRSAASRGLLAVGPLGRATSLITQSGKNTKVISLPDPPPNSRLHTPFGLDLFGLWPRRRLLSIATRRESLFKCVERSLAAKLSVSKPIDFAMPSHLWKMIAPRSSPAGRRKCAPRATYDGRPARERMQLMSASGLLCGAT